MSISTRPEVISSFQHHHKCQCLHQTFVMSYSQAAAGCKIQRAFSSCKACIACCWLVFNSSGINLWSLNILNTSNEHGEEACTERACGLTADWAAHSWKHVTSYFHQAFRQILLSSHTLYPLLMISKRKLFLNHNLH